MSAENPLTCFTIACVAHSIQTLRQRENRIIFIERLFFAIEYHFFDREIRHQGIQHDDVLVKLLLQVILVK